MHPLRPPYAPTMPSDSVSNLAHIVGMMESINPLQIPAISLSKAHQAQKVTNQGAQRREFVLSRVIIERLLQSVRGLDCARVQTKSGSY
jgi:hypothetical protein